MRQNVGVIALGVALAMLPFGAALTGGSSRGDVVYQARQSVGERVWGLMQRHAV
jgi:hypothetical protein